MQNVISSMLQTMKQMTNTTLTENGAVTLRSTGADTLDLFATVGALRNASEHEIILRFQRAWCENRLQALKIMFYARDVRGGLGERRVFRTLLRWLAVNEAAVVSKNIALIPEYGRWDDVLVLLGTPCEAAALELIGQQLKQDVQAMQEHKDVSLLGKWLPSVNASNGEAVRQAHKLARSLNMNAAQYRHLLSSLRAEIRILENNLRLKDYTFDYAVQPSKAMFKYRRAFIRNDNVRYIQYLQRVHKGEASMHTGTLMPYELVRSALHVRGDQQERQALDVTWNALEDFTDNRNSLAVVDGSGSMYGWSNPTPAEVALSLGIYFAQHNKGAFHNHFITFSTSPQLVEIKGQDLVEQVQYCKSFNECSDTNIEKVFELVLNAAVQQHLPQKDLPETLYIISDMEFNWCARDASLSNFENAKRLYAAHGYRLPYIVFWNVASRNQQQPVSMNEQGVALVSGCSPRIFSMVIEGQTNPYLYMMQILASPRYQRISL